MGKKGHPLRIAGVLNNVKLQMMDSLGTTNNFTTTLLVVKDLSCGFNISGPWLHLMKMDQLHPQGCLRRGSNTFPMYSSMAHARQHLLSVKEPPSKTEQLSVISEDTMKVYTKSQGITMIPSQSGTTITAVLTDPIPIVQSGVNMFNYSSSFLHKMNKYPWR